MNNFSKYSDINAVMRKAEETLQNINQKYQVFLNQPVNDEFLVDIKDYFGNLRSALDYLGQKIPNFNDNFPITNSNKNFVNKIKGKNINQDIEHILEKLQPYNENSWLQWFSILNNKSKHLTLIPQKRKETKEFSIKKDGGSLTARGCTFRGNVKFGVGGVSVPIDERSQFPLDTPGVEIQRTIWIDFLFDDNVSPDLPNNISVLPFLNLCFENIKKIILEIEALI